MLILLTLRELQRLCQKNSCITSFSRLIIHPHLTFRYYQSSYNTILVRLHVVSNHVVEVRTTNHITNAQR